MATPTWVTLANANTYSQVGSTSYTVGFTTGVDISPGGNSSGLAFQTQPSQLYPGQLWRFSANGTWTATACPGLAIGIYYGGVAGSPLCVASIAAGASPSSPSSAAWYLQAMGRLIQPGPSSAIWQVIGKLCGPFNSATNDAGTTMMPVYTNNATYDTASAHIITVGACATAATSSISCFSWAIEYMTEP